MGSAPSKPTVSPDTHDEKHAIDVATSQFDSLNLDAPVSVNGSLLLENVASWEADVAASSKAQLARTILAHTNLQTALLSRPAVVADTHVFSHEIDFKTSPITNQKSSGRCWLFATTNVLRYEVMKSLKLKEFQLSQVRSFMPPTVSLF